MNLSAAWHRACRNRERALRGIGGKVARAMSEMANARNRAEAAEAELRNLRAALATDDVRDALEAALGRVELMERRDGQRVKTAAGLYETLRGVRGLLGAALRHRGDHAPDCAARAGEPCSCYLRNARLEPGRGPRWSQRRGRRAG